jgi:pyruvate,water dikinase
VIASLFKARAIYYYKTKGFSEEEMVMAAGILRMIDAMSAGVIYTRDPNAPERNSLIINAIWGLGKPVVDGSLEPDSYIVSREDGTVLQKRIVEKKTMLICSNKGDTEEISVPDEIRHKPCLTNEQIKSLLKAAMFLENYYGSPQDIEWAINKDNKLFILQTRPLRIFKIQDSKFKIPRKVEGCNILIDKGVIACRGIGYGKAFILKDEDELKKFPDGAILVARQASTKFVTIMNKASAIITDIGCATEHMASISREYQVPTILDSKIATSIIKDGHEITVDAINCNVYEGRVNELLIYKPQSSTFKDTHLFKTMQQILRWITPLNLTDPADENFKPEYCKTFHDITRFAHEMAMAEMFSIGEGYDTRGLQTVALKAGIPVDVVMMDIDGGIKEKVKKASPEDILSIPFSAFLKGMLSMSWHEPRTADAKGFFHMMATTASMPEDQLRQIGTKSFAIISKNYMNFSIRLGYHFSQVEAYAGDKMNDNYIRFFFKGGGSSPDRKLRRVRLIKEILRSMDIRNVSVKEDMINAVLIGYNRSIIKEKLAIIGKLTAYTKQLDMVMYNDAVTDWHIEEFVKEHMKGIE